MAIGAVVGLALPPLGVGLLLLVPEITAMYDPSRQAVVMEYRRPLGRKVRQYPLAEIADVTPMSTGRNSYALALKLKSGERVRLDLGGTSNVGRLREKAAQIKAQIGMTATSG
jgi:hypothetical protein